jgi:hypothetical protein
MCAATFEGVVTRAKFSSSVNIRERFSLSSALCLLQLNHHHACDRHEKAVMARILGRYCISHAAGAGLLTT